MRVISRIVILLICIGCIDRFDFELQSYNDEALSVDGFISDGPGPYTVFVNRVFDIESKGSVRAPMSVKQVTITDNTGVSEVLTETEPGKYQTSRSGIRGTAGRSYRLRIQNYDGRVYESAPDTLFSGGEIDTIFHEYESAGFNIRASGSNAGSQAKHFLWTFMGTFMAETHPELADVGKTKCNPIPEEYGRCNLLPLCSGYHIISPPSVKPPVFEVIAPCTCCICWYTIYGTTPVLSKAFENPTGRYDGKEIYQLPIDGWIFKNKVFVQVTQRSLSTNAYRFWNAVRDQKEAIGSLFQPITGRIPSNFLQTEGQPKRIEGLFYATSVHAKSMYITREDVEDISLIPTTVPATISCLELFPNATTESPPYWKD